MMSIDNETRRRTRMQIAERYASGVEVPQLAHEFGVSKSLVYRALKEAGIPVRDMRGSHFRKVGNRREIVEEYENGRSMPAIGRAHGITRQRVHQILRSESVVTGHRNRKREALPERPCAECGRMFVPKHEKQKYPYRECWHKRRTRGTKAEKAYLLRKQGLLWREVGEELGLSATAATVAARHHAMKWNRTWPLSVRRETG